jgi:glutaredoxin
MRRQMRARDVDGPRRVTRWWAPGPRGTGAWPWLRCAAAWLAMVALLSVAAAATAADPLPPQPAAAASAAASGSSSAPASASAAPTQQRIEVFVREGCPHCAKAEEFLARLAQERPDVDIVIRDVMKEPAALARLQEIARSTTPATRACRRSSSAGS